MSSFFIASLKHTHKHHEHIVWWGSLGRGYTPVIGEYIGAYCYGEACSLNDGVDYIAIPADAVLTLAVPTPFYKPGARLYDQPGPVVENTRANWGVLLAARLKPEFEDLARPKPEIFRGTRRALPPQVAEGEACLDSPDRPRAEGCRP